jgi:hypothetical protein
LYQVRKAIVRRPGRQGQDKRPGGLDSKPADPKYGGYLGTRIGLYNCHWPGPSQSWLKALKYDNRMIIWAAKKAEEAARYILNEKED